MSLRLLPFDYAVRNLARSPRRLSGVLIGNAVVVLMIVAAAAFVEGMRSTLDPGEANRNVILLGAGSEESVERSEIPASTAGIVAASVPGIRRVGGVPFVSPEIVAAMVLRDAPDSTVERRAIIRGFTPAAFLVHPRVEIIEGRVPSAGSNEIMIGSMAAEKMGTLSQRLAIGDALWLGMHEWRVVGRFQARGTVMDGEVWVPLTDLMLTTRRETISCVVVTLDDAEFADLDAFTKMRVDLELTAIEESEYYAALVRFYQPVAVMIWTTAILVAMAGILGGLNTSYAAFASRVREIGMLQSLGYSRRAIIVSLTTESMIAAATGVLIALVLARAFLEGRAVSFSMGVFALTINSVVLFAATAAGVLLGLLGAIPPSIRCLRLRIPEALKSS